MTGDAVVLIVLLGALYLAFAIPVGSRVRRERRSASAPAPAIGALLAGAGWPVVLGWWWLQFFVGRRDHVFRRR